MSSALAGRWTPCDRLLQRWRYRMVMPHLPRNGVVVDLGCGSGTFLRHICGNISHGCGIDVDVPADEGNLVFRKGDLNHYLPVQTAFADAITSLAVIEHLTDTGIFVAEIRRVLKPGGTCILTTPTPAAKPLLEFLAYRLKIISENDIRDHKHYFTENELRQLFADFSSVSVRRFQLGLNMVIVARR